MQLVRLGRGTWDVLAVCDARGNCPVLEFLDRLEGDGRGRLANHVIQMLGVEIPHHGPPRSSERSKELLEGIYELRRQPGAGPKLRVLYFFDRNRVIVCTEAFLKAERTPQAALVRAVALRHAYRRAQAAGLLQIRTAPK